MDVSMKFSFLVRYAIREVILERIKILEIDFVLEKLEALTVKDVQNLNLFKGEKIIDESEIVWVCTRSTLYRFMVDILFLHDDRITYHKYRKLRADVI